MASLYIKDPATVAAIARLAKRTGQTKTAVVRELAAEREARLDRASGGGDLEGKLREFYRRFPPERPAVTPNHRSFFDAMWGEAD